jgi:hypothetical protein
VRDQPGVGVGSEAVAAVGQFGAGFRKVVQLTVEDDLHALVFVGKWLASVGEANDTEAAASKAQAGPAEKTVIV